jgi:hypothetical protein
LLTGQNYYSSLKYGTRRNTGNGGGGIDDGLGEICYKYRLFPSGAISNNFILLKNI